MMSFSAHLVVIVPCVFVSVVQMLVVVHDLSRPVQMIVLRG